MNVEILGSPVDWTTAMNPGACCDAVGFLLIKLICIGAGFQD